MNANIFEDYLNRKIDLKFWDVNLWTGPEIEPSFISSENVQQTIDLAAKHYLCGGIISHSAGFQYDDEYGNELLLEQINLNPFWAGVTLTPERFFDVNEGKQYLAKLIARGARLARVFPKSGNFDFKSWNLQNMIKVLCDFRLPLMIWQTQVSWDEINLICSAHPDLKLILEGNPQKIMYHNRRFYSLMAEHKNLFIETHNVIGFLAVEDMVKRLGADRLIFGSYMPYWDPDATLMAITHGRISDSEKTLIAHKNLEKLINSVVVEYDR